MDTPAGVRSAIAAQLVQPVAAAPTSEVDAHLAKCDEHLRSAARDLVDGLRNPAAAAAYEGGMHAIHALMAARGVRVRKDNPAELGDHAVRIEFLRHELRHAQHLDREKADAIADQFDRIRRLRNTEAYRPRTVDERSAKEAVTTGRKVTRQVLIILNRAASDLESLR